MAFVPWTTPDPHLPPLTDSSVAVTYQPSPWQAPFFIPVPSLDLGDPLCLQVSTARSPAALYTLEGSGAVPPSPPLVLVSAFPSVALPALPHNLCVYVFVEAADWGLPARSAEGKQCRAWGARVLFTVRAFGRLSSLPRLARLNAHTAFGRLLKAHTGEEDLENSLASCFISA